MSQAATSLTQAAIQVLKTADPLEKCMAARAAAAMSGAGAPVFSAIDQPPPDKPARPSRPVVTAPTKAPKRRLGSVEGRIALLHAIAHIELNAIDLAFDMLARFARRISAMGLDARAFAADWAVIGADEARHFMLIKKRLADLGADYGDLPVHSGLWDVATATPDNVLARLVVAPLILEARGLDVTPGMVKKLIAVNDPASADVLQTIYDEEIGHVAAGERWFHAICRQSGKEPQETFKILQQRYFPAGPKPPFNHEAREKAGLPRAYYEPN